MSNHEYTPKSKAGKWFNDRLPLLTLSSHLSDYPTPKNLNYWWISLVFVFGILSHVSRAVRWKMLIKPLGYKPGIINMFMSVFVLYFINILSLY